MINNSINIAKEVFELEMRELIRVKEKIDEEFSNVVELIFETKGRVIVTGIGKSGIIGRKIAASFASTGTNAFFMHSAEALHGDLGMVYRDDIVIAISNSGESQEVLDMLPSIKKIGATIVAMTGNVNSSLAKEAKYVLDIGIEKEACPLDLAPTSSTTATLVMGDALTVALINKRDFKQEKFALYHPGGSIGRRLLTRVKDLMSKELPIVYEDSDLREIIYNISSKRLGMTVVCDKDKNPVGLITDGDIRRNLFDKYENLSLVKAKEIMTIGFKSIESNELASEAWRIMNENNISNLVVLEGEKLVGVVTMHDVFEFEK